MDCLVIVCVLFGVFHVEHYYIYYSYNGNSI